MGIEYFLQQLVNGICLGGMYALMSVGYSLVYSIMNFSNFAHGGVIMVGAYVGYLALTALNVPFLPAFLLCGVGSGLLAVIIERLVYSPLRKRHAPSLYFIISAMGASIFLENFVIATIDGTPRNYPPIFDNRINIGGISLGVDRLLMIVVSYSFAKPILKIADIANQMANLDFDVRYPVHTKDEIGLLGHSINALSDKLENTILELKSANNELQKDIQNKIQIDEMRKEFLSNVSHELKTPIALIQGYAEGLQDNINDDQESREFYCEVIIDEANKMNKMVKKLLTLNQIEFGSDQVHFERFDIVQVLRSSVNSATLLAEQKDAEILFYETDPVYVWADEYMIEEVITNYISNAVNHVDGERVIRVTMERRGDVERISVFNTGKTIPEEDLDKIWIKFYKVDKARTRAYGGNGIGLSIVKAIMDSMNQKCGVINHEIGVEFWFDIAVIW